MPRSSSRLHSFASRSATNDATHIPLYSRILAFIAHLDKSSSLHNIVPGAERPWKGRLVFRPGESKTHPREVDVFDAAVLQFAALGGSRVPIMTAALDFGEGSVVNVDVQHVHHRVTTPDRWTFQSSTYTRPGQPVPDRTTWRLQNPQGGLSAGVIIHFYLFPFGHGRVKLVQAKPEILRIRIGFFLDYLYQDRPTFRGVDATAIEFSDFAVHPLSLDADHIRWHWEVTVLLQGIWAPHAVEVDERLVGKKDEVYAFILPGQENRLKPSAAHGPYRPSPVHVPISHCPSADGPCLFAEDEEDAWTFTKRDGYPVPPTSHISLRTALRTTWTLRTTRGDLVLVHFVARHPYEAWVHGHARDVKEVRAFEVGKRGVSRVDVFRREEGGF
ncbi:hypothetical protein JCM8097_003074 [Rhodosporidiobolus ruineniae]